MTVVVSDVVVVCENIPPVPFTVTTVLHHTNGVLWLFFVWQEKSGAPPE